MTQLSDLGDCSINSSLSGQIPVNETCPCCGYCRHCGRSNPQVAQPYVPYMTIYPPYHYIGGIYPSPYTVTSDTNTAQGINPYLNYCSGGQNYNTATGRTESI